MRDATRRPPAGIPSPWSRRGVLLWGAGCLGGAVRAQPGAASEPILLGQSCQLTGPLAALTSEVRAGAQLYFDIVNAAGGIGGREVRVVALDDAYDPQRAAQNTQLLVDQGVTALFQFAGTPGSLAAAPIAEQRRVPFFAPFTGSDALRTTSNPWVFNIKAGYGDELEAIVRQLTSVGVRSAAVAYLDNPFGTGGLAKVEKSAAAHGLQLLARVPLAVDGSHLKRAVQAIASRNPPAVILVSAGKPSVDFAAAYLQAGHRTTFYMLSVTSNSQLVATLGEKARGIVISQVVPSPWNQSLKLVREFQALARDAGIREYTFSQLEGFISAKAIVEALRRAGRHVNREKLAAALESMHRVDLGGYLVELSAASRSSGRFVDLMILGADGRFRK